MGWYDWNFRFGRQWVCRAGGYVHEHNTEWEVSRCKRYHDGKSSKHINTKNELTAAKDRNITYLSQISAMKDELTHAKVNLEKEKNAGLELKKQLVEKEKELVESRAKAEIDLLQARKEASKELQLEKARYLQEFAKLLITDEPDMDSALQWVKEDTASDPPMHTMVCILETYRANRKQTRTTSNSYYRQRHEVHVSA